MKEVTKERILTIVNDKIENCSITSEQYSDDLTEFGMDSIHFIQIIVSMEEEFECEFPDSKLILYEMNTIDKMYDVLKNIDSISNI